MFDSETLLLWTSLGWTYLLYGFVFLGPLTVLVATVYSLIVSISSTKTPSLSEGEGASVEGDAPESQAPRFTKPVRYQWILAGLIGVMAVGALIYRWTVAQTLEQTAVLFIGLPMVLGILLALIPRAGSLIGMVVKGITIALLLSMMVAWEGFICVFMAAPLFYLMGIIAALVIEQFKHSKPLQCSFLLILCVASLEGAWPGFTLPTTETVTVSRDVSYTSSDIARRLNQPPEFSESLPPLLGLGFPKPLGAKGRTSLSQKEYVIHFGPSEGRPPGDLVLRQTQSQPEHQEYVMVEDKSHISHWLTWNTSRISWAPLDGGGSRVTWTLSFERDLSPAWYFIPLERFFVSQSIEYLMDTYFPS